MGGGKRREQKMIPCKVCGEIYESGLSMMAHMRKHKKQAKQEQQTL